VPQAGACAPPRRLKEKGKKKKRKKKKEERKEGRPIVSSISSLPYLLASHLWGAEEG